MSFTVIPRGPKPKPPIPLHRYMYRACRDIERITRTALTCAPTDSWSQYLLPMARYWPLKGGRHDAALIVGGFLSRCGYTPSRIKDLVECVAKIAGCEDYKGRATDAEDAATARLQGMMDRPFGKVVADQIAEWLDHKRGGVRVRHAPDGVP
jgi:hypothetical protein